MVEPVPPIMPPRYTIVQKAKTELTKLKGVRAVAYGFKETKGRPTGEHAILVFVDLKKTIDTIPIKEIIPSKFEGVKTDVFELHKRVAR